MTVMLTLAFSFLRLAQNGEATRGQGDFRACAPCHSLEPDRKHDLGQVWACLWGRKAGSLRALNATRMRSNLGIIWDEPFARRWLTDPQAMVPENEHCRRGIKDAAVRADLLAFLKNAPNREGAPQQTAQQAHERDGGMMAGMGGMMGGRRDPNLKSLEPGQQVKAITYCHDHLSCHDRRRQDARLLERNLRFNDRLRPGRAGKGTPAITPAGDDGRQGFGDFRRAGGVHEDDRSAGADGIGPHRRLRVVSCLDNFMEGSMMNAVLRALGMAFAMDGKSCGR